MSATTCCCGGAQVESSEVTDQDGVSGRSRCGSACRWEPATMPGRCDCHEQRKQNPHRTIVDDHRSICWPKRVLAVPFQGRLEVPFIAM